MPQSAPDREVLFASLQAALAVIGRTPAVLGGLLEGLDAAVLGHLDRERVEVHDRVQRLQGPGAPGGDLLKHSVGDPADRVATDLHPVEALEVSLDVAHGHPAGIHVEDALIQAG